MIETIRGAGKGLSHIFATSLICVLPSIEAAAQTSDSPVPINTYGMPGMIDMPVARSFEDAQTTATFSAIDGQRNTTLSFQITPRLTGAFRYAIVDDFRGLNLTNFDRSFDLHYRIFDEGPIMPSVAVGLRDLAGTGLFSGEYVVASKQLGKRVLVTAGMGWGAYGTQNSFENPLGILDSGFETRTRRSSLGGEPNAGQWFRGPAAAFAGVSWQMSDRLTFNAEYSSDAQSRELAGGPDGLASPFNFGLQYRIGAGSTLSAQVIHGETIGLSAHFALNPRTPPYGGDTSPAPIPVLKRGDTAATWAGAITQDAIPDDRRVNVVSTLLENEDISLVAIAIRQNSVLVRISNEGFDSQTQAIGRTARILALSMPSGIETFEIESMRRGVPISRVKLQRSMLERLENAPDAISQSLAETKITAGRNDPDMVNLPEDKLSWSVSPFLGLSLFEPNNPVRADLGVQFAASYAFSPSLTLSGAVRAKLLGNRDEIAFSSNSVLPRVRSNRGLYDKASDVWLNNLSLSHVGRLSDDIYTRVSVGYLEEMFAGVSGEILWKPVDSRLALGLEVNHVFQRDNDRLFGFDDYDYDVTTGHLSAYYAMQSGFDLQLDVGRYLAGDWGGTIGVDRRFGNGWSIGAFATLTDVSFEDFGEGSFDKGIRFTIPLAWALGRPNNTYASSAVRPIQRDGGARLNVSGRLYPTVRNLHGPELRDQWGRFWR